MVLVMLQIHAMHPRHVLLLGLVTVGAGQIVPPMIMGALETSLPLALQARLVILQVLLLRTKLGLVIGPIHTYLAVESSHQI
jgi:hypothetical protein